MSLCNVPGDELDSILFAAEKAGAQQFIDTALDLITTRSGGAKLTVAEVTLGVTRSRPSSPGAEHVLAGLL